MYAQFWCWVIGSWQMPSKSGESIEKSWQLMMDGGKNVITVWPAYNGRNKLRPGRTEGVRSDGSPHLSGYNCKVSGLFRKNRQLMMDGGENVNTVWPAYNHRNKLRASDQMGHHTWVLVIMEFKVRTVNTKSCQFGSKNVITVWPAYNGRNKQRPD